MPTPLPIDAQLPRLVEILRGGRNLVLVAEPGAGKTTRMPRALLDGGLLGEGECWVLEPRRLAARLAAARVAEELGEELGQRAGYAVRFEQKVSKATRIRFVTEGLLLRRLQEDPQLRGIAVVILDEFHERHLHTDLALTLLRRLQRASRPELRLVVMSATLEADPVAAFLEGVTLRCEGRAHPVAITHLTRPDDRPLAVQVAAALEASADRAGHRLVFLPGAGEIRACERALAPLAERQGWSVLPLHGSLSFEAQKAAVAPSEHPKVLLSTNVAESSVTIDGVATVIDSGLGREAVHSPWSGLSSLRTARISQARCVQRAGRAGRQGPGLCQRLFTEADFRARAAFDAPELHRSDLTESLLALHGAGIEEPGSLAWFQAPPSDSLEAAERQLARLGALAAGRLTPVGRRMASLPLHPRLARLVVEADALGIPQLGRLAAALLETGDLLARTSLEARKGGPGHGLDSDLWARLDAYREAEAAHFGAGAIRAAGLDGAAVRQARLTFEALLDRRRPAPAEPVDAEERLLRALLVAYGDRLAKAGGTGTFALRGGGGARLDAASRVRNADLIVALEAEAIRGKQSEVLIRAASKVEAEWLLEAFHEDLRDEESLAFNPANGRVERFSRLWLEDLCLEETRRAADPQDPRTAAILAQVVLEKGLGEAQGRIDDLLARVAFLASRRADLELPSREDLRVRLLERGCAGCRELRELERVDWGWLLRDLLGAEASRSLETWAPEFVQLPRRRVRVNYGEDGPWIESRLQDFLGLKEGPRLAGGQVPLKLHLLAPNHRAVQITTDLAGFWQRAYQELRPQLSRRYPRHAWPEDPLAAFKDER
jgi:ATP-dependent helicase HrpB